MPDMLATSPSPLPNPPAAIPSVTISWRPERSIKRNDSARRDRARSRVSVSVGATTTMVLRYVSAQSVWQGARVNQSINQDRSSSNGLARGRLGQGGERPR